MTPCTFSIKFSYGTQFTFGSLMFAAREDRNIELLTQGPTPKCLTPVYGVIDSGPNTKVSRASVWTSSISFDQLVYIRWCLLMFESLCKAIPSRRQDHTGNPYRGTYLLAIGWNIELLIDSVPWLGIH
jgi:hypothetical protein